MLQLILHLVGDYCTQSDWMAAEKTKSSVAAGAHALVYALPFVLLTRSPLALAVILGSHFLIDRFRLARYLVYAKNYLSPRSTVTIEYVEVFITPGGKSHYEERNHVTRYWFPWSECSATGYHKERPVWLAVWLMIAADNTIHLACNYAALRWL